MLTKEINILFIAPFKHKHDNFQFVGQNITRETGLFFQKCFSFQIMLSDSLRQPPRRAGLLCTHARDEAAA